MSISSLPAATRTVLEDVASDFQFSDGDLSNLANAFVTEFSTGLKERGHPVVMGPSFITHIPNGTEKGKFLTLGIRWTTLRVSEVTLNGNHTAEQKHKTFYISEELTHGEATDFFSFIAESVAAALAEFGTPTDQALPLGVLFAFGLEKTAVNRGRLISWSKGVHINGAVGQDVSVLLQEAFDRTGVNAKVGALVNDTVGLLLAETYGHGAATLATTFGVGTNGAFVQDVSDITKLKGISGSKMLVNSEWGAFSKRDLLKQTKYDDKVDREDENPGAYLFEKQVSWKYIGDVVREIVISFASQSPALLFNGVVPEWLKVEGGFDSRYLAQIDVATSLDEVKQALAEVTGLEVSAVSDQDAIIVQWAAKTVADRAIKLSAAAIAGGLVHSGYAKLGGGAPVPSQKLVIAADGEMTWFYPEFENRLRGYLRQLVGSDLEASLKLSSVMDADAIGAALALYGAQESD